MKATSHFAIAHLLYASLQKRGIFLNRVAFVYGNIAPDYTPAMWVAPHFGKVCSRSTADIIDELSDRPVSSSGKVSAEYSKKLGNMCHFLCDYFCFAHNGDFSGGLKQHVAYENELDAYLRKNCLKVLDIDGIGSVESCGGTRGLINHIEEAKAEYLNAGHSPRNDLTFAYNACISSITNLIAISKRVPVPAPGFDYDDIAASLKGYATGRNLIFRMFFFKYRNCNLFFLPDLMPPIGAY